MRAPGYDQGEGRRNWRALDLGTVQCFLEADSPRVNCPEHGPTVAQVPWARHGAGHTQDFDDQVAWLVTHTPKSAVSELMRIAWRTVGSIIARVVADGRAAHDPFEGLTRHRDRRDQLQARPPLPPRLRRPRLRPPGLGRGRAGQGDFRDSSTSWGRSAVKGQPGHADGAEWIAEVVAERCPKATLCIDASTWWPGPPTPSTMCAARSGTKRASAA